MKPQYPHRTAAVLAALVTAWMVLQTVASSFTPPPAAGERPALARDPSAGTATRGA
jgi:hypothetical protein